MPFTSSDSKWLLCTDCIYFSHQCLCMSVSLHSFFLILLLLALLLFAKCSILCSYYSFSAFLLSPFLPCHFCVIEVRCLKGRVMPVFMLLLNVVRCIPCLWRSWIWLIPTYFPSGRLSFIAVETWKWTFCFAGAISVLLCSGCGLVCWFCFSPYFNESSTRVWQRRHTFFLFLTMY